jgi:hypothetical protein
VVSAVQEILSRQGDVSVEVATVIEIFDPA